MEKNISHIIMEDFKKTAAKYGAVFRKLPWTIAKHAFLFIVLAAALEAAIGTFLFYQYIFIPKTQEIQITGAPETFQEKTYQSVLEAWNVRQAIIENPVKEVYNNPFN